jgi:hypothetical protein
LFTSLLTLFLTVSFVMVASPAVAGGGVSRLKGDIIINKKGRFPSRFESDAAMAKYMRRVNTHELTAEGDDDWSFEYMAFLPKPVATLQAAVSFYDVTVPGSQKLIDTFTFYPGDRKQNILNGHARLSKDKFRPDRKYLMVFSRGYGQRALAKTKIVLRRR